MKRFYETAVILIGTLGWWSYVYPELSQTQQAYVQEAESGIQEAGTGAQETGTGTRKAEMCKKKPRKSAQEIETGDAGILERLGGEGIRVGENRIKSRIAEYVYQVKEEPLEKGAEDDR